MGCSTPTMQTITTPYPTTADSLAVRTAEFARLTRVLARFERTRTLALADGVEWRATMVGGAIEALESALQALGREIRRIAEAL